MFSEYYGFREQPFGVTPDPRFLYFGTSHREALASLYYGVESGRGFLALIAKPGMGKTTLLFQLLSKLRSSASTAFLFQTQCDSRQLLRAVITDLGVETREDDDLFHLQNQLNAILIRESEAGRRFALVVDEAQNLDDSVLETLRMLSNFETPRAKLMQIILAGQPQLATKLASEKMIQLRQRVSVMTRLVPLSATEVADYIQHRLMVAGYSGDPLFSSEAVDLITSASEGIPRNINNLCFHSLTLGFALAEKRISASMVEEVLADLDLEPAASEAQVPKGMTGNNSTTPTAPAAISVRAPELQLAGGITRITDATKHCVRWLNSPLGKPSSPFLGPKAGIRKQAVGPMEASKAALLSRVRRVGAMAIILGTISGAAWLTSRGADSTFVTKQHSGDTSHATHTTTKTDVNLTPYIVSVAANPGTKRLARAIVQSVPRRGTSYDALRSLTSSDSFVGLRILRSDFPVTPTGWVYGNLGHKTFASFDQSCTAQFSSRELAPRPQAPMIYFLGLPAPLQSISCGANTSRNNAAAGGSHNSFTEKFDANSGNFHESNEANSNDQQSSVQTHPRD